MSVVFVDTFSGGVGTMRGKSDPMKVLRVLKSDPNISCFDESESPSLHKSLNTLVRCGYILLERRGYPWTRAIITEVGENALAKAGGLKQQSETYVRNVQ